jgi:hypothetical protein
MEMELNAASFSIRIRDAVRPTAQADYELGGYVPAGAITTQ